MVFYQIEVLHRRRDIQDYRDAVAKDDNQRI